MDNAIAGWDVALLQGYLVTCDKNVSVIIHCNNEIVARVEGEEASPLGQSSCVLCWCTDVDEDKLAQQFAVFFQQETFHSTLSELAEGIVGWSKHGTRLPLRDIQEGSDICCVQKSEESGEAKILHEHISDGHGWLREGGLHNVDYAVSGLASVELRDFNTICKDILRNGCMREEKISKLKDSKIDSCTSLTIRYYIYPAPRMHNEGRVM